MSAIVCGKRSFFEDLPTPTPVSKRIRCSSSSPVRYSPPRTSSVNSQRLAAVDNLLAAFPGMDKELIERVLDECGDDLDSAIRSLNVLRLGSSDVSIAGKLNGNNFPNSQHETLGMYYNEFRRQLVNNWMDLASNTLLQYCQGPDTPVLLPAYMFFLLTQPFVGTLLDVSLCRIVYFGICACQFYLLIIGAYSPDAAAAIDTVSNGERGPLEGQSAQNNLAMDGAQWVELFVSEMMSASNMDDARVRASRALEALEKSIVARAGAEATQPFQQENAILKEQVQALVQENTILKRAVAIQHERQKDYEDKTQELQHLKQLISQYQEQLRTLEVNNYALAMHLKQSQQHSSISGQFNPDVF